MKFFYHYQDETNRLTTKTTNFNLTDEKGRKVGYLSIINSVKSLFVFDSEDALTAHFEQNPGTPRYYRILPFETADYYEVVTHTLRNGETFGALTRDFHVGTLAGAHKKEDRRFRASLKRYKKKYGGK